MTFNSFDTVFFTAAFLVPGFVWESVLHMFLRRREDRADRVWVRLLTLSALNYGFLSWLVYLLLAQVGVLARPWVAALAWFFIVFISPAALGAASGLLGQRTAVRRLLARYGIYTVHPVPTAWDYVFSQSAGSWVLITLADGSTVAGVFSARSFASSEPSHRDLYLEQIYEIEDDGPWQPVPMNRGVWIRGEAIRTIEFLAFQE
jgi:hypothetical protein